MISALIALTLTLGVDTSPPPAENQAAYQQEKANVSRTADSHIRLALWCEAHGMDSERLQHLAIAVALDPANTLARGLMGFVADGTKWRKPDQDAERLKAKETLAITMAEYNGLREKMAKTADAHWKMALWCEEKGLKAEETAHLTAVTRLDPSRAAAWKRLGFKRINGHWQTDAQVAAHRAEVEAQKKADQQWRPKLASWKAILHDKNPARHAEALAGLAGVKDPRAAASIWKVFAEGNPADQALAVQLFGQLDSPLASQCLALLALNGASVDVRRAATQTLKGRDPRDYMAPLIALLRTELRYEVRPVNGPGSQGVLFVEGEQFNRMRIYAPPAMGFNFVDNGLTGATDAYGNAVIANIPDTEKEYSAYRKPVERLTGAEFRHGLKPGDPRQFALTQALGPNRP